MMIVRCSTCTRIRIDPSVESVREVVDNGQVVEAWALAIEHKPEVEGIKVDECPYCERTKK